MSNFRVRNVSLYRRHVVACDEHFEARNITFVASLAFFAFQLLL